MSENGRTYPAQIVVYCDGCGVEEVGDYVVSEEMTQLERIACARRCLNPQGWSCTEESDLCPSCSALDERPRTEADCRCSIGGGEECPCEADGEDGLCACCRPPDGEHRGTCASAALGK